MVTTNEISYARVQKVSSQSVILDHWLIVRVLVQNRAPCEDFLHQCSFRTNGEWLQAARGAQDALAPPSDACSLEFQDLLPRDEHNKSQQAPSS